MLEGRALGIALTLGCVEGAGLSGTNIFRRVLVGLFQHLFV
jgi:hypothetical protein